MKTMHATLTTISLTTAEPGQPVAKNRLQLDFVIPDTAEAAARNLAIAITVILVMWQSFILSLVATSIGIVNTDIFVNWYFVTVTVGIFLWVFFASGGGSTPLRQS